MSGSVGFIGGGNMAEAILIGILKSGLAPEQVSVYEPDQGRARYLSETYQVRIAENNRQVVETSHLVVLAIKPQIIDLVLPEITKGWSSGKILVSILAGVTTAGLEKGFATEVSVVRAMPNTPAMIGEAATAICPGRFTTGAELEEARQVFVAIGDVVAVEEVQMDAVTGLSGSGPAYIYSVIEALAAGGVANGLTEAVALKLAAQTVVGAARMVQETAEAPSVLRDRVCSPGGTTVAAIQVLEDRDLRSVLMAAVAAATKRSKELGRP